MSLGRVEENELVERAKSGDHAAFEKLVELHQHEVFNLAVRLVGDRMLAEDVVQEAFIRAWRALPGFRGEAAFGTWLYRITANTSFTHRARKKVVTDLDAIPQPVEMHPAANPVEHSEIVLLRGALRHALAQLSEEHRRVVMLKDLEGWSHQEIAESLDISVSLAKVRLHRGRKQLRFIWEGQHAAD